MLVKVFYSAIIKSSIQIMTIWADAYPKHQANALELFGGRHERFCDLINIHFVFIISHNTLCSVFCA